LDNRRRWDTLASHSQPDAILVATGIGRTAQKWLLALVDTVVDVDELVKRVATSLFGPGLGELSGVGVEWVGGNLVIDVVSVNCGANGGIQGSEGNWVVEWGSNWVLDSVGIRSGGSTDVDHCGQSGTISLLGWDGHSLGVREALVECTSFELLFDTGWDRVHRNVLFLSGTGPHLCVGKDGWSSLDGEVVAWLAASVGHQAVPCSRFTGEFKPVIISSVVAVAGSG